MPGRVFYRYSKETELIFEIGDAEDGGYCARAIGPAIFTKAETREALRENVLEAVLLHFEDGAVRPRLLQLHYVKDELIPVDSKTGAEEPPPLSIGPTPALA